MSEKKIQKINYLMIFVDEFAKSAGLDARQAYNYLDRMGGMDFLDKHYDVMHTFDFQYAIDDIKEVCQANGGQI